MRARDAEMKDAGGKRGIGFAARKNVVEMRDRACAAGGDDGNVHRFADRRGELAIEAGSRAVRVHRCEQNLSGAAGLGFARPFNDATASGFAAALHEDLCITDRVSSFGVATRVNRDNHGLRAEAATNGIDECGVGKRGGVHADLIGASIEDLFRVVSAANAAAYAERNEELTGCAADGVKKGLAAFVGCGDVEKDNFVGAFAGMASCKLRGVASVNDVDELHAFDDASSVHVKTGNDAFSQHVCPLDSSARKLRRILRPEWPDF